MKLREKDNVLVINGRDRGKSGEIKQVFPKEGTALVEGVNIATKHVKSQGQGREGGIIKTEIPINVSNLMRNSFILNKYRSYHIINISLQNSQCVTFHVD